MPEGWGYTAQSNSVQGTSHNLHRAQGTGHKGTPASPLPCLVRLVRHFSAILSATPLPAGYACDAMITVGGCDKSVPGALLPLLRTNAVGLTMFGGAAMFGECPKDMHNAQYREQIGRLDPGKVMESIGAYSNGIIDLEDLDKIERCSAARSRLGLLLQGAGSPPPQWQAVGCSSAASGSGLGGRALGPLLRCCRSVWPRRCGLPGSGTCAAMFTACSMACAVEAMGMSLPGGTGHVAISPEKEADCRDSVQALIEVCLPQSCP